MITNRVELNEYLLADKKALGRIRRRPAFNDYIWKYEINVIKLNSDDRIIS